MRLIIEKLMCGYGKKKIIENISFSITNGECICLLGPNGVGKTTFFKTVLGFIKPLNGSITLDNKDITKLSRKNFAKVIAYVPQAHSIPFAFSTIDVVVSGRNAHLGITSKPTPKDYKIALECMEELGIGYLKDKLYTQISGGEQQMVLIARALVQEPKILVLDEPTSNLDFGNQIRILNQINMLKKKNIAIIMTTHAPDHAFLCGTKVVIFQKGRFVNIGEPEKIITESLLKEVYGVDVKVHNLLTNINESKKICVPCLEAL
ncbi:ABC transporter ATP-binding protein [Anaerovorax odorimutans]|uniref:ABC transporter ATP-binding protein n=1 Tax=Anaerovorax odorimutans TaxID=109327 RepID=UPI0004290D8D|nr:ABC transporter ATP-binding protein [Anaerovorax odorimutans]